MKSLLLAPLLLLALAGVAQAAGKTPPAELDAARKALADAVASKDVKAIAALSSFPLTIDVYKVPPKLTEKQFGKKHLDMFFGGGDAGVVKCIRSGDLARNDPKDPSGKAFGEAWYADCDGNEYFFAERGGRWLFSGYQNVNE